MSIPNHLEEMIAQQVNEPIALSKLWEHRKEFLELPDAVIQKYPGAAICVAKILFMEGRLAEAEKYMKLVSQTPLLCDYIQLVSPSLPRYGFHRVVSRLVKASEQGQTFPKLILTAGRPSVLNGFRDFTEYGRYLKRYKEPIVQSIRALYGDVATGVYEIALAEHLYWKNECFESLVLVVGTIPFMENRKDVRCLFAALTLEIFVLIANGQAASVVPLIANMRQKLLQYGSEELEHNLQALEVWAAMYDGHTEQINQWMKEAAPDEHGNFNMLDTFRYMIKLRCYLIQGKHMALLSLAEKLRRLLKQGRRVMDLCELSMIQAMSFHEQGRNQEAFDLLEQVLHIAEKYQYDRLLGDEGSRMYRLLYDYRRERGNFPYLCRVMEFARKAGLLYPHYLKVHYGTIEKLSGMERDVLKLMAEEKSNQEIGEYLDISLNTVKFHSKNIYKKLSVASRGQAVKRAREVGVL